MHVQAHMSGQLSGQVPNQAGLQLPGMSQQNANPLSHQMQSLGGFWSTCNMDPDFSMARKCIRDKISQLLVQKHASPGMQQKLPDVVRRLEDILLRDASSKEEYMNEKTLEHRLQNVVKRMNTNNHGQQHQNPHLMTSSSSIGTMIPTPGMNQSGNTHLMITSSGDNSLNNTNMVTPNNINSGNLLSNANSSGIVHGGSFNVSDGLLANGYQQPPANFSMGPGANALMSSMNASKIAAQMMPTPGFSNPQSLPMSSECSGGGGSSSEPAMIQQQQPKQYIGSQNSRILQSLGSQMGMGLRSNLQHKVTSYGFPNGAINGGLQLTGNNMQLMNGSAVSDGYLNVSSYANSPKPVQQHFDQQRQQQMMQQSLPQSMIPLTGDIYGMNNVDMSGSGGLYGPTIPVGSTMNNQILSPGSMQLKSKHSSAMLAHHQQVAQMRPQMVDQSAKMNFQTTQSNREHLLQSQQQMQKFQEQHIQQQPYTQIVQHQHQQKQQNQQHQLLLKNDILRQPQMSFAVGGQSMAEHGMEPSGNGLHHQMSEKYHMSELQNQYQQQSTVVEDHSKGTQLVCNSSNSQDFHSSFSQISQQMQQQQILHACQQSAEPQNTFSNLSAGPQAEVLLQGQWHTQSADKLRKMAIDQPSIDQIVQEQFHQRITGLDEAQRPHPLLEEGTVGGAPVACHGAAVHENAVACAAMNDKREEDYRKQRRWLIFLRHAHSCPAPEGTCVAANCLTARKLCWHIKECNEENCLFPRCHQSKKLIEHHKRCTLPNCPVCIPVHQYLAAQRKARISPPKDNVATHSVNGIWKNVDAGDASIVPLKNSVSTTGNLEDLQSSVKRIKMDRSSPLVKAENALVPVASIGRPPVSQEAQPQIGRQIETLVAVKSEVVEPKAKQLSVNFGPVKSPTLSETMKNDFEGVHTTKPPVSSIVQSELIGHAKHENMLIEKENGQLKPELKQESTALPTDPVSGTKSGKPKVKGVSLTELFTAEQVREHIRGLRQWVGQSKAKAEKNQAMEHSMSENSCQLCAVEKLTFEPPPIYCTPCGARIKRNAMYYTVGTGESRHYFCILCYNEARGDTIEADGVPIPKARLEKKKNDEETEEWWVQCDKCEAWQHQICALFNGRRNDGGQAEYTCPNCYVTEVDRGERQPLPQSAVLGAKDLPKTILSDHIEQRLARRLKQERQERAKLQGKSYDEVLGAESLVVRVVSSVDKKLEVKQRFLEIFQEDNYPTEFPYKSKVVLLFQMIEGVEVCLFGMYVQEFGSECQFPNQRRVYLSYLDSVKYFRPEIKAVTGEALRTFVYHEILIGYLEYCKKRGFTSCYIWACPPLKGEDYILYCHPEIQKTPKSDKLREWYLAMLRKAFRENIVVDLTNLYDHFFVSIGESKAKVTAARLPYFDGDYWPGAAEDMINQLRQEEDGRKQQKKGKTKKTITKRALKAAGHTDLSANASKDALLMQKLGETICPMKEDFIMVHLQHPCTHCCHLMVSGKRWVCGQCKNFQLCDKCYNEEQKLEDRERHPINSKEKHMLNLIEINGVPADTKDKDEILESEFFDTRQAFLSLCQGNHYQYDTLRRAKHSSMMVLYHLHNPTAPAFVTTCNICQLDIEAGQGWRCEICPDFDVCNACFRKDGGIDHPHKLTNHPSTAERDAQNKEARQKRVKQLRRMLDLLVHASHCRFPQCKYPNCRQVKGLFRHGMLCKIRAAGGCLLCKKMWYLLQLHARACKESGCLVPRCKDLKEHVRRMQQQSDSRRRAAVMEMMRQRAAEVAGNSG